METKSLEIKVGFFVVLGLVLLGAMVVQFGRLGEGIRKTYKLTAEFENAAGVFKDAEVLMAGAKIGRVSRAPEVLPQGGGVSIILTVFQGIQIPKESTFHIGSSGLLGDRFVDVRMPKEMSGQFLAPGDLVRGEREKGFEDITKEGTALLKELRGTVKRIDAILLKLNEELLKAETLQNLDQMIANLKETSAKFSGAATTLNDVMNEAKGAVTKATGAIGEADKTIKEVGGAVDDARDALAALEKAFVAMTKGDGLVARLLTDSELGNNLSALIENLRKGGVLFYRDRAAKEQNQHEEETPSRPKTRVRP